MLNTFVRYIIQVLWPQLIIAWLVARVKTIHPTNFKHILSDGKRFTLNYTLVTA